MAGTLPTTFLSAAACGVLFHVSTISVEWDYKILPLLQVYIASMLVAPLCLPMIFNLGVFQAIGTTFYISLSFIIGLITSIGAHRLFFHRVRKFPGPFFPKLSRFYFAHLTATVGQPHLYVQNLHKKYGDVVRTGQ